MSYQPQINGLKYPIPPYPRRMKEKGLFESPNPQNHKIISFIKSGVRILGYTLIPFYIELAVTILVISEFIGIIEELV